MAEDEEKIRLALELLGAETISEAVVKLRDLRKASAEVAAGFQVVETREEAAAVVVQETTDEEVRAANERVSAQRAVARAVEDTTQAVARSANEVSNQFNVKLKQAGMVLQDLAQGNGLAAAHMAERFASSFGLMGTAVIGLGIAYQVLKPVLDEVMEAISHLGKKHIPEAADATERLTEKLKKHKETLEELKKEQYLDRAEMELYRGQVQKVADEEDKLAKAREARAVGPYNDTASRKRAGEFQAAVAEFGGSENVIHALRDAGLAEDIVNYQLSTALKGDQSIINKVFEHVPGLHKKALALEGVRQQKIIDEMSAEQEKKDKAAAERHKKALQARRKRQDAATEEAQRFNEEWPAELAMIEEQEQRESAHKQQHAETERRRAETERHRAEEAHKKAQHEQAMRESRQLVTDQWREGMMRGEIERPPTPAEIEHMATGALRNLEHAATGWMAAAEAYKEQLRTIYHATMVLQGGQMNEGMSPMVRPTMGRDGWGGG